MKPTALEEIAKKGDHLEFANEELPEQTFTGVVLDRCLFRQIGLKRVTFRDGSIQPVSYTHLTLPTSDLV